MIRTKLAHYEITSHIGSGGMGDVYEATDTKLGRSVAIKFLPEAFSHDTERVARFQREARVLASFNHPNIAAIHGVEEIDSHHFLVMELITGETLDSDSIGNAGNFWGIGCNSSPSDSATSLCSGSRQKQVVHIRNFRLVSWHMDG